MADGNIRITIDVDGKQVNVASKELDNLESAGVRSGKGVKSAEDSLKGVGREAPKASGGIKAFAASLGLVAIGAAAFRTLKASMDAAINRFDTLNRFPKVLQGLGVSAEDSERAMSRLSDGIDGLPTLLNDIASTAQRMYTSFNDMDKSTDSALALNNALLASGASTAEVQRGTEQYIKALQTGRFDMQTWQSLQQTMSLGLVKVSEAFGMTEQEMYKALQSGAVSIDDFNNKMIELGTGTGLLADLARENTMGIATSLSNLRVAATRGITHIIESFDELSRQVTGRDIAENIDNMKVIVFSAFQTVGSVIERTTPIVAAFASGVQAGIPVVQALTPAIIGLTTAYGAYIVITKASAAIKTSTAIIKAAQASTVGLTLATKAKTAAVATSTTATAAGTVAQAAQTGAVKLSTLAIGVMTGTISASTAVKVTATAASYTLGAGIKFMLGPIGLVTAGIGLLTAATVGIVRWFKRSSAEAKKLNSETEELGDSTSSLADSVESSAKAYKDSQSDLKASAQTNRDLVKEIENLSEKENKSAAEKMLLKDRIEQLNGAVEGLNLAYNEEADALSMSSNELSARIDLLEEETSYNAALERQKEIITERNEAEAKLDEINSLREEWNQKLDDGSVKSREHKRAIEELDEQEEILKETTADLAAQYEEAQGQINESIEAITEATENGVISQIIAFEDLSESQQKTVESMKSTWEDYKDSATDMFDTLSDEAEVTVQEMTANLEENQRIIGEWADNIAKLAERGIDEGLLEELRQAGPESAGHVNALVNASDEELQRLSTAFAEGGDVATKALSKSLGIEESGVMAAVGHLVTDTEKALSEQVKSADFPSAGVDVAYGFAGGMEDGTPKVEQVSSDMAKGAEEAAKDAAGIRSPSRVFTEIGENMAEGLTLGISNGTNKILKAMKGVLADSLKGFRSINSDFNSIGRNAMDGLNQGLLSRRTQVMNTARSIANQVASTMQSALRISSPSRVMKDDVGRWIPEGLALGIKDGAKSVYRELSTLSDNMVEYSSPEVALGVSGVGGLTSFNQPLIAGAKSKALRIAGTIRVEGVTNQGQVVGAAEIVLDGLKNEGVIRKIDERLGEQKVRKNRALGIGH